MPWAVAVARQKESPDTGRVAARSAYGFWASLYAANAANRDSTC